MSTTAREVRAQESVLEVDYDVNVTNLYAAITQSDWDAALQACELHPEEAETWVVRKERTEDGHVVEREDDDNDTIESHDSQDSHKSNEQNNNGTMGGKRRENIMWRFLPLHSAAARTPPTAFIRSLLSCSPSAGTAASTPDDQGMLPLHYACGNRASKGVIKLLLDAYPEAVGVKDPNGMLPLHYLASWGPGEDDDSSENEDVRGGVVELMIEAMLDQGLEDLLDAKDGEGMTPVDMTKEGNYEGWEEVAEILESYLREMDLRVQECELERERTLKQNRKKEHDRVQSNNKLDRMGLTVIVDKDPMQDAQRNMKSPSPRNATIGHASPQHRSTSSASRDRSTSRPRSSSRDRSASRSRPTSRPRSSFRTHSSSPMKSRMSYENADLMPPPHSTRSYNSQISYNHQSNQGHIQHYVESRSPSYGSVGSTTFREDSKTPRSSGRSTHNLGFGFDRQQTDRQPAATTSSSLSRFSSREGPPPISIPSPRNTTMASPRTIPSPRGTPRTITPRSTTFQDQQHQYQTHQDEESQQEVKELTKLLAQLRREKESAELRAAAAERRLLKQEEENANLRNKVDESESILLSQLRREKESAELRAATAERQLLMQQEENHKLGESESMFLAQLRREKESAELRATAAERRLLKQDKEKVDLRNKLDESELMVRQHQETIARLERELAIQVEQMGQQQMQMKPQIPYQLEAKLQTVIQDIAQSEKHLSEIVDTAAKRENARQVLSQKRKKMILELLRAEEEGDESELENASGHQFRYEGDELGVAFEKQLKRMEDIRGEIEGLKSDARVDDHFGRNQDSGVSRSPAAVGFGGRVGAGAGVGRDIGAAENDANGVHGVSSGRDWRESGISGMSNTIAYLEGLRAGRDGSGGRDRVEIGSYSGAGIGAMGVRGARDVGPGSMSPSISGGTGEGRIESHNLFRRNINI